MITLEDIDTKGKPWILQTDNPMFGFVQCDKNGYYEEKNRFTIQSFQTKTMETK